LKLVTLHLPKEWVRTLDKAVSEGLYPNRSEALRYYIREGFKEDRLWRKELETTMIEGVGNTKRVVTKKEKERKRNQEGK